MDISEFYSADNYNNSNEVVGFLRLEGKNTNMQTVVNIMPYNTHTITISQGTEVIYTMQCGHREQILAVIARELSPAIATMFAESTEYEDKFAYVPHMQVVIK